MKFSRDLFSARFALHISLIHALKKILLSCKCRLHIKAFSVTLHTDWVPVNMFTKLYWSMLRTAYSELLQLEYNFSLQLKICGLCLLCMCKKERACFSLCTLTKSCMFLYQARSLGLGFFFWNWQIAASHCFVRSSIVFMKVISAIGLRYSCKTLKSRKRSSASIMKCCS